MFDYWCDYVNPKYGKKAKLCYKNTDSFIVQIKSEEIYEDLVENIKVRSDTSSYYDVAKPLPISKRRQVIGLMTDE